MIKDFVPLAGLERPGLRRLGHLRRHRLRGGRQRQGSGANACSKKLKEPLSAIKPMKAVFDPEYIRRINGPNVKEARHQDGQGGDADGRHRAIPQDQQQLARLVMIWCGSTEVFHRPGGGAPDAEGFRMRADAERSGHRAQPDLCVRGAEVRRAVRQRRAEPDHRHAGAAGTGARAQSSHLRQGFQDRPDVHEDADRARA